MMAAMNRSNRALTTKRIRVLALGATTVATLALSACGGGDDTSATTTASIPTEQLAPAALAKEADSLCSDAYDQLAGRSDAPDFGTDGPQADELDAAVPYFEASAEIQQQLYDELAQLQPAGKVAAKWKRFLAAFQTGSVEFAHNIAEEAKAGNGDELFNVALKSQNDLAALAQSASALGMKVCGAQTTPSGNQMPS